METFLDTLSAKPAQKVTWVLRLVRDLERVPAHYLKKLPGTEELWEVRAEHGGDALRLLGFFDDIGSLVLVSGLSKRSERTPSREILLAERRRRDYLSRRKPNG